MIAFGAILPRLAIDTLGIPYISYRNALDGGTWVVYWDGSSWQHELVDALSRWDFAYIQIDPNNQPSLSYKGSELGISGLKFAHK
jgi:hypothetical protein